MPKNKKKGDEIYKEQFTGTYLVAIRTNQKPDDQIHAPDHAPFTDSSGAAREVKCPKCVARYSIGYKIKYCPQETFEKLESQLTKLLLVDHANHRLHRNAIPLTSFD